MDTTDVNMKFESSTNTPENTERFSVSTEDVLEELFEHKDAILEFAQKEDEAEATQGAREYVLADTPNSRQLQRLAHLPFEISITEHEGSLVLSTGTTHSSSHNYIIEGYRHDPVWKRHLSSKVSFHTHPDGKGADEVSLADIETAVVAKSPVIISSKNILIVINFDEKVSKKDIENFSAIFYIELEKYRNGEVDEDSVWQSEDKAIELIREKLDNKMLISTFEYDDSEIEEKLSELLNVAT